MAPPPLRESPLGTNVLVLFILLDAKARRRGLGNGAPGPPQGRPCWAAPNTRRTRLDNLDSFHVFVWFMKMINDFSIERTEHVPTLLQASNFPVTIRPRKRPARSRFCFKPTGRRYTYTAVADWGGAIAAGASLAPRILL